MKKYTRILIKLIQKGWYVQSLGNFPDSLVFVHNCTPNGELYLDQWGQGSCFGCKAKFPVKYHEIPFQTMKKLETIGRLKDL